MAAEMRYGSPLCHRHYMPPEMAPLAVMTSVISSKAPPNPYPDHRPLEHIYEWYENVSQMALLLLLAHVVTWDYQAPGDNIVIAIPNRLIEI